MASLIAIHSDIGGSLVKATEVPAQALPHIQLLPVGAGLKVAVLSRLVLLPKAVPITARGQAVKP